MNYKCGTCAHQYLCKVTIEKGTNCADYLEDEYEEVGIDLRDKKWTETSYKRGKLSEIYRVSDQEGPEVVRRSFWSLLRGCRLFIYHDRSN